MADFSQYNDGKRGGKVRVRAKIKNMNKILYYITELPFHLIVIINKFYN